MNMQMHSSDVFCEKGILLQKSREDICAEVVFLIKLLASSLKLY